MVIFYSLFFVTLMMASVIALVTMCSMHQWADFIFHRELAAAARYPLMLALCMFALWVLLLSKDVRLYQEMRRRVISEKELFHYYQRLFCVRPQPSIHAP